MTARILSFCALVALATTAFADTSAPTPVKGMKVVVLPSGLEYVDIRKGTGAEAKAYKKLVIHYTGWLADGSNTKFDSSVDRHEPFEFTLGAGQVIRGWDEGLEGMKVGGRRQLHIPAKLAYGDKGVGKIPPGSDLVFDCALIDVK
ncbi:MAG TPA: FKBP-type peptidyl-prolyl cis-trans isomerase [Polyangia bacterium]|jgi:FKBP-type peptidyl-prolyl cis-trans isomerase|nr:FKBP-type peptidyl-prolyl cis-trans isomerase [Polyangia bacterium]